MLLVAQMAEMSALPMVEKLDVQQVLRLVVPSVSHLVAE